MALVFRILAAWALLAATGAAQETALLVEIASGRVVRRTGPAVEPARPGSAIKPFTLVAMIEAGIDVRKELACRRTLRLGSHGLNCSHPMAASRLDGAHAIGYSCNSYFSTQALGLKAVDLQRTLLAFGFRAGRAASAPDRQLQALGEELVAVTPEELAEAYRRLAKRRGEARLAPVFEGLAQAVDVGTAQAAGAEFLGKTGTTSPAMGGSPQAWFAGIAPRRNPTHVLVVFVRTGRGGADAAPAAAKWWQAWKP